MLILRSQHARVDRRGLHAEQLCLRRDDIRLRDGPASELIARDIQRALVLDGRTIEEILQRVGRAKIEVGRQQGRLRRKLGVLEIGRADLRRSRLRLDRPAYPTPDIDIPGRVDRRREARVERRPDAARAGLGYARAVGCGHSRKQPGLPLFDHLASERVIRHGRGDGLV